MTTQQGIPTASPNHKLYDTIYVTGLEDANEELERDNEKLRRQLNALAKSNGHALAEPPASQALAKMEHDVFIGEVHKTDLERLLNDGFTKWHAQFEDGRLRVALVRLRPADTAALAQPEVADKKPKTVAPSAIDSPDADDKSPEVPAEPAQLPNRALINAVATQGAASVKADMNAHNITRILRNYARRPRPLFPRNLIGAPQ